MKALIAHCNCHCCSCLCCFACILFYFPMRFSFCLVFHAHSLAPSCTLFAAAHSLYLCRLQSCQVLRGQAISSLTALLLGCPVSLARSFQLARSSCAARSGQRGRMVAAAAPRPPCHPLPLHPVVASYLVTLWCCCCCCCILHCFVLCFVLLLAVQRPPLGP